MSFAAGRKNTGLLWGAALALSGGLWGCPPANRAPDSAASAPSGGAASTSTSARSPGDDAFRALAASRVDAFAGALKQALMKGIQAGGIPGAISVCRDQAPALAAAHSDASLQVRRVGTRVRNPANRPSPALAAQLAALRPETPDAVVHLAGQRTYVRAIYAQPLCLNCHGKTLTPDVTAALSRLYPGDEAVGYEAGDLRGAFVVSERQTGRP